MFTSLQSWLEEPRVENGPRFVWRDWLLIAGLTAALVCEVVFRDDIRAPFVAVPLVFGVGLALPWRRTHPRAVGIAAFGGVIVFDIVAVIAGYGALNVYAAALLLITMYSTFRWGSGSDTAIVSALAFILYILSNAFDYTGVADTISGLVVLLLPAAVAVSIRYVGRSREQAREQIRVNERERIARDLHDTVAHHVSAIAIQAQAGRFVAGSGSLQGASEALEIIEEEASRTLSEMRSIVGALRDADASVEMAPQHGIADIASLRSTVGTPVVNVSMDDGVHDVGPAIGAALYRIAQESVTNARRHAVEASAVEVEVQALPGRVVLCVTDDGARVDSPRVSGFGLIGMAERATLLGGTLDAGPEPTRGWRVIAALPRES